MTESWGTFVHAVDVPPLFAVERFTSWMTFCVEAVDAPEKRMRFTIMVFVREPVIEKKSVAEAATARLEIAAE